MSRPDVATPKDFADFLREAEGADPLSVSLAWAMTTYYDGNPGDKGKLYAKMLNVATRVDSVPESGWNSFHKYHYVMERDLIAGIRPLLLEQGLFVAMGCVSLPADVVRKTKTGETFVTTVAVRFAVIDVLTGASHVGIVIGRGEDPADKGAYKAYTGAQKYFLQKTFMIPTGDDPERDGEGGGYDDEPPPPSRSASQLPPRQPQRQTATQPKPQPEPPRTPEAKQAAPTATPAAAPTPADDAEPDSKHALRAELQHWVTEASKLPANKMDEKETRSSTAAAMLVSDATAEEGKLSKAVEYMRYVGKKYGLMPPQMDMFPGTKGGQRGPAPFSD